MKSKPYVGVYATADSVVRAVFRLYGLFVLLGVDHQMPGTLDLSLKCGAQDSMSIKLSLMFLRV